MFHDEMGFKTKLIKLIRKSKLKGVVERKQSNVEGVFYTEARVQGWDSDVTKFFRKLEKEYPSANCQIIDSDFNESYVGILKSEEGIPIVIPLWPYYNVRS